MHRRLILAAGTALVAWLLATGPAGADGLDRVQKAGVLRVAVPQDFPPFGTVGPEMEARGYDVDVAGLLATALGVRLQLVPVTSANRISYLQTRKVDLVVSSLGKNPERERVIDFSAPYAPFFSGVFGPAGSAVATAADLAGRTVGVTRGAIEDLELSRIAPTGVVIKRYEDNAGTISAFLSGQVELIATGNTVAAAILAQDPPKKPIVQFLIKNSPCHVGLNQGEPRLLEAVNEAIARARRDGSLDAIARRWLGAALPADL